MKNETELIKLAFQLGYASAQDDMQKQASWWKPLLALGGGALGAGIPLAGLAFKQWKDKTKAQAKNQGMQAVLDAQRPTQRIAGL